MDEGGISSSHDDRRDIAAADHLEGVASFPKSFTETLIRKSNIMTKGVENVKWVGRFLGGGCGRCLEDLLLLPFVIFHPLCDIGTFQTTRSNYYTLKCSFSFSPSPSPGGRLCVAGRTSRLDPNVLRLYGIFLLLQTLLILLTLTALH